MEPYKSFKRPFKEPLQIPVINNPRPLNPEILNPKSHPRNSYRSLDLDPEDP